MSWAAVLLTASMAGQTSSVEPAHVTRVFHRAPLVVRSVSGRSSGSASVQAGETITAVQIHGNTVTADDDARRLAGIAVGMPFESRTIDEVAARLRASGRFKQVDV